jgi:hypothetical protein
MVENWPSLHDEVWRPIRLSGQARGGTNKTGATMGPWEYLALRLLLDQLRQQRHEAAQNTEQHPWVIVWQQHELV